MNTIKSAYGRLKTHWLIVLAWSVVALITSFLNPILAAIIYFWLLMFIFWPQRKGVVSIILAACIALQSQGQTTNAPPSNGNPDGPKIVGPCMCIVVLVVGVVVVYQLVKFCKAHLPPPSYNPDPPTNNVPTNNIPTNGIPTNFPAITIVTNASIPDSGQRTFTMNCRVSPDGELVLEQSPNGTGYWDGNSGPTPDQYFGSLPTAQANVNVDYTNGVLSITEPGIATRMIILERSTDAVNWTPIATNVWSINFRQVSEVDADAPETQAFYRVR